MYSRSTCANIGGVYGYAEGGRYYRSDSSGHGQRTDQHHCLFDTFNCAA